MSAAIAVGIAGWSYADWKGIVYPRGCKDTLRYSAGYVDCIEINSTFYRLPDARYCASWVERTADRAEFFFTAKLPRQFTHEQIVDDAVVRETRAGFAPLVAAGKLPALLAQFDHAFAASDPSLAPLDAIAGGFEGFAPVVVELRHRSWASTENLERLAALGLSVANLDYPGAESGFGLRVTGVYGPASVAYLRLHGRNHRAWFSKEAGRDETYDYEYSSREVEHLARRAREIASGAERTIVIANNHYQGKELEVALELSAALTGERVRVPPDLLATYPNLKSVAAGAQGGLFG